MKKEDTGRGQEDGIMTVHDVAKYLRLSEAKVYYLARQNCIPAIRLGKSWRFRRDLIDEWMRKQAVVVTGS